MRNVRGSLVQPLRSWFVKRIRSRPSSWRRPLGGTCGGWPEPEGDRAAFRDL